MPRRPIEYDSSNPENDESQNLRGKDENSSKKSVSSFYKSLYGYITSSKRRKISHAESANRGVISSTEGVEAPKVVLDIIEQEDPVEQRKIADEYRFAMLDQAVHPDEFMKTLQIAKQSHLEAQPFKGKTKKSQDKEEHLLIWERDRERLNNLLQQMKKNADQVIEEVKEALPELEKKAQRTLDWLEQIPNWQDKVAQLEERTQKKLQLSRGLMKKYLGADDSDVAEEIKVENYIGDASTKGPRFYAELAYRTRTLSKLIDRIIDPADLQWQGSPERKLKELVNKVANDINSLGTARFQNVKALQGYIYHSLAAKKDGQQGFSIPTNNEEYDRSINSIVCPLRMRRFTYQGYLFFKRGSGQDYERKGRFVVNMHPDAMLDGDQEINGKTKEMMEKVTQLNCVYLAKVICTADRAVLRLDPVVIEINMADSQNKDVVADCLRPYAEFTRPDLSMGSERIDKGIGYANESVVERYSSWTEMITKSIAEVAWATGRPITFEKLWPRVESDLRAKGMIEL